MKALLKTLLGPGNFFGAIFVIVTAAWPFFVAYLGLNGYDWRYIYGVGAVRLVFGILAVAAVPFAFVILWVGLDIAQELSRAFRLPRIVPSFRQVVWPVLGLLLAELLWTFYCAWVPIKNSPELLAGVMLAIVVCFIASRGPSRSAETIRIGAILAVVVMTVLFWFAVPAEAAPTPPRPESAAYSVSRAKDWLAEKYIEATQSDFIDVSPGDVEEIPFAKGMKTRMFRGSGFLPAGSPWRIRLDIDATALCTVKFTDGTTFVEGPGLEPNYGTRNPFFTITGIESGVATVSCWMEPVPVAQ